MPLDLFQSRGYHCERIADAQGGEICAGVVLEGGHERLVGDAGRPGLEIERGGVRSVNCCTGNSNWWSTVGTEERRVEHAGTISNCGCVQTCQGGDAAGSSGRVMR